MNDPHDWAKPVGQLAISIPISFKCIRLGFEERKDIIGRTTASKLVGKGVLVEFHANLLAVVIESFIEYSLKRYSSHLVDGLLKRYAALR